MLEKRYHNKITKPKNYAPGNKIWFNTKFIKIKQNIKLEAKFYKSFRDLDQVKK